MRTEDSDRLPPDLIDLFGVLATAGSTFSDAADALYSAHVQDKRPPPQTLAAVRGAAARVLATLADYDDATSGGA